MTPAPTRKRRRWPAAAAAAVAAAVIVGSALLLPSVLDRSGESSAVVPAGPAVIPAVAPADSDTFVLAAYSPEWWAKIAAMASPESRMLEADPVPAGFTLDRIGYSRSPDKEKRDVPMTGPLRLFYLEAPSAEEAGKIAAWLQTAPGYENRRIHVLERVIIVSPTWVPSYTPPVTTMATVPGYKVDEGPGKGTYWMNVDQETASLTGGSSEGAAKAAESFIRHGLGFAEGTTWLGTSDAGDSWAGRFAAGGVKPETINFGTVNLDVRATEVVLATRKEGNVNYKILGASPAQALDAAHITAEGQSGVLGTGDKGTFPEVTKPVVSASLNVTGWDAAFTGRSGANENVATRNISANESEMVLSFGFAKK